VASGFGAGSGATISSITTTYTICPTASTTVAPPVTGAPVTGAGPGPTPAPVCQVACNFEAGNTCSYLPITNVKQGGGNKRWAVKQGPFGNPDTGVPHAATGTHYLGVRLAKKGDKAVLATSGLKLYKAAQLKFQAYEATRNCQVKVCVNTINHCLYSSNPGVDLSDRQWKHGAIPINQNTKKVFIVAQNTGNDICYVGFDDFEVVGGGTNCPASG